MMNGQLELSLETGRGGEVVDHLPRRPSRAAWWFARMRQAVERAWDWQPVPPPRAEQIWFPEEPRNVRVSSPCA